MFNNIAFIGGIHAAGKGTVCTSIMQELNIYHLSASEVLKWKELNTDGTNKKVRDISETQDRLIAGLHRVILPDLYYLLDGHFCLFDKDGHVNKVPLQTFRDIKPILIAVVTCDVTIIKKRLEERDLKEYDYEVLEMMQKAEVEYSQRVATELHVPYVESENGDYRRIVQTLKLILK